MRSTPSPVHPPVAPVPAGPRPAPWRPATTAEGTSRALGPGLLALLALALVAALAARPFIPPRPLPADAPPEAFSAARALPHLEAIAARPHQVGSPENARVRDYLLAQLAALGLQPQVQRAAVLAPRDGGAVVENVLARLPGSAGDGAVLFVAHYDSVAGAPGVGDNGMNVAAMLETLRALRAGPAPRNDLIFLFDDGEEAGKLGAVAFIREHPWAREVQMVFDFDAEGPVGPATLMWTTPGDGWLVGEIGRSGAGLLAASMDNPGKRAESGNNLHVFAAAGYRGANIDRIGGSTYYHSARDNLANLDLASLQGQGAAMLALARHFGSLPIGDPRTDDAVFFTLLGLPIVSYPVDWALPLALLAALALAGAVGLGLRRGQLTPRGMALALLALLAGALAAALAGHLAWPPIAASHAESRVFAERAFYGQGLHLGGLYLLTLALLLVAAPRLMARLGRENVTAAGVTWLVVAALLVAVVDPLASYLALWPALAGALGLLGLAAIPARGAGAWAWARLAVPLVAAAPAIGLLGAVVYDTTIDGFGDSPAGAFAIIVLLVGALAMPIERVARLARRALPAGVAAAGIALLVAGVLTSGYSAAQPRPDTLLYVLDADAGRAYWASPDPQLDEWTGQFLADAAPRTTDEIFGDGGAATLRASRAPVAPLPPPRLELIAAEAAGDEVTLRARLISPRGADRAWIIPRDGAQLLAAGIDGAPPAPIESGALNIDGLPAGGLELALRLRAAGPIRLTVLDVSTGLPDIPGLSLPARPATVMAAPNPEELRGYPTAVRASFALTP